MRCECCKETENLIVCGDVDEPTLYFCDRHYEQHVRDAHNGKPLPGCKVISPSEDSDLGK